MRHLRSRATIDFTKDRPEVAEELSVLDLEGPIDRARALKWLQDRTNVFVNALRPRIRSILRDLAPE